MCDLSTQTGNYNNSLRYSLQLRINTVTLDECYTQTFEHLSVPGERILLPEVSSISFPANRFFLWGVLPYSN